MRYLGPVFCLALLAALAASGGTIASSTFSANGEGWIGLTADPTTSGVPVVLNSLTLTFHASGGNPGGYVSILDADSNDTFFAAPAAGFLGDISLALNGTLQYSAMTGQTGDYAGPLVVIKGNGIVLVYRTGSQPAGINVWAPVTFPIGPDANWRVNSGSATLGDFQTALANVSDFWITAETHNGVAEITGLDSVTLSSPDSAVPEPSTLLLMGVGLAIAGLLRRYRRACSLAAVFPRK
jgi:hypothetical protein